MQSMLERNWTMWTTSGPSAESSRLARLVAAGLCAAMLAAGGCASHVNYPPIGTAEEDSAVNDPNTAPTPVVIQTALKHIINRFPVDGPYVVNLPSGMLQTRASEIVGSLKDPGAALPSRATANLPVYHVIRVGIRPLDKATVEILRPVFGVGYPGSPEQYQPVTVHLRRSPLEPWKVDSVRVWPIGMTQPPELYGWSNGDSTAPFEEVPAPYNEMPRSDSPPQQVN